MAAKKESPAPPRSKKAGRPPVASASSPKARRGKSATVSVSKGTVVMQSDKGSRAAWSAAKPMWKKR